MEPPSECDERFHERIISDDGSTHDDSRNLSAAI
jgi:hypothetical protein